MLFKNDEGLDNPFPLYQELPRLGGFSGMEIVRYLKVPRTYSVPTQLVPVSEIDEWKGRSLSDRSVEASDKRPANAAVSE